MQIKKFAVMVSGGGSNLQQLIDATVKGEQRFDGASPSLCAISAGRVAVLCERRDDLSGRTLQVFDKNARSIYELTLDADHPIGVAGNAVELAFGGELLYVRTLDGLFRFSEDGETLTSVSISRDTLAILPTEKEVLVCTPAYAARLSAEDFAE